MRTQIGALPISLFVLAFATLCPTPVYALEPANLPDAVESAQTAADHEVLAAHFEAEAKGARAAAERHRSMGARYEKLRKPAGLKGVRHRTMADHCARLVESYEAAAKEFEAMAAEHREAAREIE